MTRADKILVIEDEDNLNELETSILQANGWPDPLSARTGHEGLKLVAEHSQEIVLIILDMYLPDMDGVQFLEKLKELGFGDKRVVLVSGIPQEEAVSNNQIKGYLYKPFKIINFVKTLKQALSED